MLGLRKWQSKRPVHKVHTKTPQGFFYCYIRRVNKPNQFMPRKSSTTANSTTRKTRTRKTSTTRTAKAVAKTDKVIAEVQAVLDAPRVKVPAPIGKVTKVKSKVRTLKTVKRPSTARLITPSRYWSDIQTRWAIHNFEIQELLKDFTKGLEAVKPYQTQLVKLINRV